VREEFLNPFFEALGWDVYNRKGYAEPYKEVIHEAAIKVGGHTKAPDYCFRAGGGVPSFFVEAKKPSVDIRHSVSPAYQLRRYAWSAKLPVSILTDFEEFAVYDCRIGPVKTDRASTARVIYHTYKEYLDCWDELFALFSPEAVRRGALERFIGSKRAKKGTAQVDEAFLEEIQSWRKLLARNLALRNPTLSQRDLNFAVQRTIDRIVFLRICEDRGIEPYGRLQALLNGTHVYRRLGEMFQRADERYNSGLFYFSEERGRGPADELTLGLTIDDNAIKTIIRKLYYPESPYEFSVFPVEILGQVYEQFLGQVIRLTPAHRAVVEDKPEVKKAGGVYYTPGYIVDYIVRQTVGRLVEGKKPAQVTRLRVLDPACGSGSFLIGAYQFLLDWHRNYYTAHQPERHARGRNPKLYRSASDDWRLTTAEKKRILLNNIYGVDIDPQAVEVTRLSLLLKVLEGESQESLETQRRLFHQYRALPDLSRNIKCGNSLIGPDFYENRQMSLLDEEQIYRINAFDWQAEFPEVFKRKNPGFDAVIGNPPYVFGEYHDVVTKPYLESRYNVARQQYDTYWLFIERGLDLTRRTGTFSLIVPDAILARDECVTVRRLLLTSGLTAMYHCALVFTAGVSAVVFVVEHGREHDAIHVAVRQGTQARVTHSCSTSRFHKDRQCRFLIHLSDREAELLQRINAACVPLGSLVRISRGEETGKKHVTRKKFKEAVPILVGEDISRFALDPPTRFVTGPKKSWELYAAPKIVAVKTGTTCVAALDESGYVTMQSVYNIQSLNRDTDLRIVLAIINSQFIRYYVRKTFTAYKLLFPQLNQTTIKTFPIPQRTLQPGSTQGRQLAEITDQILTLHKQLAAARTPQEKTVIQRQIEATDRQIDQLVYELYGLSDEEIAIVEQSPTG